MVGTFREDLPLNFLRDYEWALSFGRPQDLVEGSSSTPPERSPGVPYAVGNGPRDASSTQEIQLVYPPAHVWDANGWYSLLGAHHRMSKTELKAAYLAADGPNDPRLTYVFTSLIDGALRRFYDLLPLGEKYLDDPQVQENLKRVAMAEAAALSARGLYTTPQQVLEALGLCVKPADSRRNMLDDHDHLGDNDLVRENGWLYSWYVWKTDPEEADLKLLEQWQLALIRICSERGIHRKITVGIFSSDDYAYLIQEIDGRQVIFIERYEFADRQLAELAVDELSKL